MEEKMQKIMDLSVKANECFANANFKDALKYYFLVLIEDMENSITHCNIAMSYEMTGELELAVAFYKKAIRLDKKNIRAINNLARIYIDNIKDYDIAQKYLDYAIEIEPNDPEAYNLYGNLSIIKKDFKLAESYLKKAIFLDENYFKNFFDLARVYIALNDKEKTLNALNKTLELNCEFEPALKLKESLK